MKLELLRYLRCSNCAGTLSLCQPGSAVEVDSGALACAACGHTYPIVRSVPRFAPSENYTSSFGFQWQHFRRTQLDSHTGVPISKTRFYAETDWTPAELNGALVLDVGCGAGRFTEIALGFGARVVALDYSTAVDACRANLDGRGPDLEIVQGDLYALPFRRGVFPFVYCFGVLQHTPDVERAFKALPSVVAPGGSLSVDVYLKNWSRRFHPRVWLRPVTTRIRPDRLFQVVRRSTPSLLAFSRAAARVPTLGRYLRRLVPVADYTGVYPLSDRQLVEWAVLDTFDWLGPRYDQPQRPAVLRRWFEEAGLIDIEVFRSHHLAGRGRIPLLETRAAGH